MQRAHENRTHHPAAAAGAGAAAAVTKSALPSGAKTSLSSLRGTLLGALVVDKLVQQVGPRRVLPVVVAHVLLDGLHGVWDGLPVRAMVMGKARTTHSARRDKAGAAGARVGAPSEHYGGGGGTSLSTV